ncbi:MAG: hypothetical protein Pg6C_17380 [Treponemataceae bacterium]|nr:MAG: hypothetical protein Pg6C_17380 [Treponemataceae bacterium]
MIAVKGIYEGGNTVKIDDSELNIAEPYEVVVSFLQPAKDLAEKKRHEEKADLAQRQKAFEGLMEFHRTLPADFDYKKELNEWRDERYGSVN